MFVPGAKPKMKTHNSDMDGLAIVIRGNKAAKNVSTGDYVLVENSTISGIADGGYKAAANVSAGTAFTSANLTALSKGAVTQIGEDVASLNSKIGNVETTYFYNANTERNTEDNRKNAMNHLITNAFPNGYFRADVRYYDGFHFVYLNMGLIDGVYRIIEYAQSLSNNERIIRWDVVASTGSYTKVFAV